VQLGASTQSGTWNVGLNAGTNAIGKLVANSGVDIGDVTVNNAAGSGAYVQPGTSTIWQVSATSSANTASNPLFVQEIAGGAGGTAVHDYQTSAALASAASVNLDYTVTATKTLHLKGIQVSGSGKVKVELKAGALADLESKAVAFTSTANPNGYIEFPEPIQVPDTSTGTVRLTVTNKDDSAQDVYAYINGVEI